MLALRAFVAAVSICVAAPASADPVTVWRPFIAEAAARFGVPETWILEVIRAESGGRTDRDGLPIRSRAGAIGLMQLMPRTWIAMRDAYRLGPDPDDPHDNILAGTAYLRLMYDAFGYPGLFAGYNAGPGRYSAYTQHGGQLPAETRAYVVRITGGVREGARPLASPLLFAIRTAALVSDVPSSAVGSIFAVSDAQLSTDSRPTTTTTTNRLFALPR